MSWSAIYATLPAIVHWLLVIILVPRVILKRRQSGVALAWLTIIALLPFVGAAVYLLVGELWLAGRRVRRARNLAPAFHKRLLELQAQAPARLENYSDLARSLDAYGFRGIGMPCFGGNKVELFCNAEQAFQTLIADINAAKHRCYFLFYIWSLRGWADRVGDALVRAAERGVDCRVLLDAVGSAPFFGSHIHHRLRQAGVQVLPALPVGRVRSALARIDLRNHRKIAAIDGKLAYCGSLNLADPDYFHVKAGCGPWVDVTARVEGPAAEALELTFQNDWCVESPDTDPQPFFDIHPEPYLPGESPVQVINSGPGQSPRATEDMLLTMFYGARNQLILTTPYFIPTESLLGSLIAAARRGVDVQIVVPERNDSRLVRLASRSYYDDLLDEGARIWHFKGGLLHAKTVTADGRVGMIGSANIDRRSFSVNFETGLFIYDPQVVVRLREHQEAYIKNSMQVDAEAWRRRPVRRKLAENATQLFAPLL